jgi:hypothetical protein
MFGGSRDWPVCSSTTGLVEAMVRDTGTRDALPSLAFTLRRLYDRAGDDGRLTLPEYEDLGGMEGSIREEAQRIMVQSNCPSNTWAEKSLASWTNERGSERVLTAHASSG